MAPFHNKFPEIYFHSSVKKKKTKTLKPEKLLYKISNILQPAAMIVHLF